MRARRRTKAGIGLLPAAHTHALGHLGTTAVQPITASAEGCPRSRRHGDHHPCPRALLPQRPRQWRASKPASAPGILAWGPDLDPPDPPMTRTRPPVRVRADPPHPAARSSVSPPAPLHHASCGEARADARDRRRFAAGRWAVRVRGPGRSTPARSRGSQDGRGPACEPAQSHLQAPGGARIGAAASSARPLIAPCPAAAHARRTACAFLCSRREVEFRERMRDRQREDARDWDAGRRPQPLRTRGRARDLRGRASTAPGISGGALRNILPPRGRATPSPREARPWAPRPAATRRKSRVPDATHPSRGDPARLARAPPISRDRGQAARA